MRFDCSSACHIIVLKDGESIVRDSEEVGSVLHDSVVTEVELVILLNGRLLLRFVVSIDIFANGAVICVGHEYAVTSSHFERCCWAGNRSTCRLDHAQLVKHFKLHVFEDEMVSLLE